MPVIQPEPEPWIIFGYDAIYWACAIFYTITSWIIITSAIVVHYHIQNNKDKIEKDFSLISCVDVQPYLKDPDTVSIHETSEDSRIEIFFERWGFFCATNPWKIIFSSLLFACLCSLGLLNYRLTTDPIELWSTPSSTARQQKDYFDEQFGPFYRTEQLIIKVNFNESEANPIFSSTEIFDRVLKLQNMILDLKSQENKTLSDFCLKPMYPENQHCTMMSATQFFQNNPATLERFSSITFFQEHLKYCMASPSDIGSGNLQSLEPGCLSNFGVPMNPLLVYGGFDTNSNSSEKFLNSTVLTITIPVPNTKDKEKLKLVKSWEKSFLELISIVKSEWKEIDYNSEERYSLEISYYAERSIEDELQRQSEGDAVTVTISYFIMFLYVATSLGQTTGLRSLCIQSKILIAFFGTFMVFLEVIMSVGLWSFFGIPLTLIVVEVVPFLVLAVGVDNIFIIVQNYQREMPTDLKNDTVEKQIARVIRKQGPSIVLSGICETAAFFLGALSSMPAVKTFSMFAGTAIFFDILMQMSAFIAIFTLDAKRETSQRLDIFCCVKIDYETDNHEEAKFLKETRQEKINLDRIQQVKRANENVLYLFMKNYLSELVLSPFMRPIILLLFLGIFCYSCAVVHMVDIGLDQKLSMPLDSYVLDYFNSLFQYLAVGAPVYFVIPEGFDYSNITNQRKIAGGIGSDKQSFVTHLKLVSEQPEHYHLAPGSPMSWIDDYLIWSERDSECCGFSNEKFMPPFSKDFDFNGTYCRGYNDKLEGDKFDALLPNFLGMNPGINCPVAGHAGYSTAVNVSCNGACSNSTLNQKPTIKATHFMTYHTVTTTSEEFTAALISSRKIAKDLNEILGFDEDLPANQKVFAYSVFYVFYEQYITIVNDTIIQLTISVSSVGIMTFFMLKFNFQAALITVITLCMMVIDMFGVMYVWKISLNAVSLVNLVMAVGIGVEFFVSIAFYILVKILF